MNLTANVGLFDTKYIFDMKIVVVYVMAVNMNNVQTCPIHNQLSGRL